jgi:N-acetylneuraminate synthase/sialic acid synthase
MKNQKKKEPCVPRELRIHHHQVADDADAFVIAEIGHNHQGSVETCKELFRAAKECGAQSVKLQKRDNRFLYTEAMFNQPYENENSYGPTYGLHREALEFGRDEYVELQRYARELGLIFFATAFDFKSADFLEDLDIPVYKIASGDLKNIPLLQYVASFKKPMVVSTGGGTLEDVRRMYEAVLPINPRLAILQCTAGYPPAFEELELKVLDTFRREFPEAVSGFSSHDSGIAMAVAAYVLGARVIEKHFTLNRAMKGTDHAFSLEPVGLKKMIRDLHRVRLALGTGDKRTFASEQKPLVKMGKKLVAVRDLPAGHVLRAEDIAIKSPGDGVPPYELPAFVGRTLNEPLGRDQALTFGHVGQAVRA